MSRRLLIFLSAVVVGFSLAGATASLPLLRLQLSFGNQLAVVSGDPLIQTACHGVGGFEKECISTLQSAPPHQKADANGLAFFTLKFVEDQAVNLTAGIKKVTLSDVSPLLQSALSDCLDQYNPLDDLIEDAINAVLGNAYADAKKFIEAAMSDIDVCDSQLKASNVEEKVENKNGDEVQLLRCNIQVA
ncbi:Unknown protein [Striga hermonthica]|uniref:Pectinesterase inhibitor domain-containing protein n=1 Tax=Striga hermonthica TaxID=68872 RepID=A0A9N7NG64_STRHE|nr:Unknown protein [Striga hermonthica]